MQMMELPLRQLENQTKKERVWKSILCATNVEKQGHYSNECDVEEEDAVKLVNK